MTGESDGQAGVEVAAGALAVLLAGLIAFQLLAAGYAAVMAGHAAEAAAIALANGRTPADAAHAAVPGWPRRAARVRSRGSRVYVTLVPPSPLRFLRDRLAVTSDAAVRTRGGER